ncbi:prepilin-type N-terminal cleavage/methylation domain-containing protein [Microcoleus sp. N3A4]|uniref:prepilin-type N-terminal cleavage/methylation domain-containing protein n=1 Tax=Microcoleus sp. N3A4 TaxID=3055379 RepID=UPI002FD10554
MKTPILLKVLQISATKVNPNYKNTRSTKGDKGFTLLEVLVIALIVGILSSIAAPGWLAFINNQRLRTSIGRVSAVMQLAQSNAKRDKVSWQASFKQQGDFVEVALHRADVTDFSKFTEAPINTASENTWIKLEQSIVLDTTNNTKPFEQVSGVYKAIFNRQGCLVKEQNFECTDNPSDFTPKQVTLNIKDAQSSAKKCVIVETILGAMRSADGNDCQ